MRHAVLRLHDALLWSMEKFREGRSLVSAAAFKRANFSCKIWVMSSSALAEAAAVQNTHTERERRLSAGVQAMCPLTALV